MIPELNKALNDIRHLKTSVKAFKKKVFWLLAGLTAIEISTIVFIIFQHIN